MCSSNHLLRSLATRLKILSQKCYKHSISDIDVSQMSCFLLHVLMSRVVTIYFRSLGATKCSRETDLKRLLKLFIQISVFLRRQYSAM